ncbi:hypothetical protein AB1Y20_015383 [Prymnesium parvum]|uniref:Autophagy-related protein 9 n=1 Tax=Prymnesium parvum TaxID=97485 RepID=A0AB34JXN4_PRYPA|mmetsp:Transcript_21852/g.50043  ORF Transcript_21852/g.50043 Transcript_21852/m.50043 type:complete len:189 (-) Transcript_21852:472-1038(-)
MQEALLQRDITAVASSRRRQAYDAKLRTYNAVLVALACSQIVLMIVLLEASYRTSCEENHFQLANKENYTTPSRHCASSEHFTAWLDGNTVTRFCAAIGGVSVLGIFFLYRYYALKWSAHYTLTLRPKDPSPPPLESLPPFWRCPVFLRPFVMELIVLIIQPFPMLPRALCALPPDPGPAQSCGADHD